MFKRFRCYVGKNLTVDAARRIARRKAKRDFRGYVSYSKTSGYITLI
ncbi:MAG TPA: hypothetical protein VMH83_06205 [Candidatus Acidoferrum sp.]|nr:hypothetical protein [Candidatus Acidoferrum sp.]